MEGIMMVIAVFQVYVPFETRGYLPLFRFRTKTTPS